MPIDLVVLDMVENSRTKIILGRSFLATVGCKIDVKKGKLTFDVGDIMLNLVYLRTLNLLLILPPMGVKCLILISL